MLLCCVPDAHDMDRFAPSLAGSTPITWTRCSALRLPVCLHLTIGVTVVLMPDHFGRS